MLSFGGRESGRSCKDISKQYWVSDRSRMNMGSLGVSTSAKYSTLTFW